MTAADDGDIIKELKIHANKENGHVMDIKQALGK
jgi:hypothetical protein